MTDRTHRASLEGPYDPPPFSTLLQRPDLRFIGSNTRLAEDHHLIGTTAYEINPAPSPICTSPPNFGLIPNPGRFLFRPRTNPSRMAESGTSGLSYPSVYRRFRKPPSLPSLFGMFPQREGQVPEAMRSPLAALRYPYSTRKERCRGASRDVAFIAIRLLTPILPQAPLQLQSQSGTGATVGKSEVMCLHQTRWSWIA